VRVLTRLRAEAGPLVAAAAVFVLLVVFSGRYGYHRDELYFLAAGHHLAWGYPDQPPLVPAIARLMSSIAPHSLPLLRLPSAFAMAGVVLLTARLAREMGADRGARTLAAVAMATCPVLFGAGHLLSTTTFGLLAWAASLVLVGRILRTREERLFVPLGLVVGAGLMDNDLLAFLMAGLVVGVLIAGPRDLFRSRWLWLGTIIAAAMWTPYLVWQARNGWPQLDVARSIASGGSGTSEPRWALLPFQLLMGNLWLMPIWVVGLVQLLRRPALGWARAVGWCWVALVVAFTVLGGKPYYLSGMFPVLFAAGAQPSLDWARRTSSRWGSLVIGGTISALIPLSITLPLVPASALDKTPIVDMNYDAGETVGWPTYVQEVMAVADRGGPSVVILASNYGEAGAVERYGHMTAYSGDMGFWWWGPPTGTAPVVAIGYDGDYLLRFFGRCTLETRLDNHLDVDDDEQGQPVHLCEGQHPDWSTLWPSFKAVG
jgi:4-amino-4-deoxy-L-arabinose transferase-like glycosyltransferase